MKYLQSFVIDGNPSQVTAQQKGVRVSNGYAVHYIKPKVKQAQRELWAKLAPYKPAKPYGGPLAVFVVWTFSRSSWENKAQKRSFKTTKSDLDNLVKGCADVMTDLGFWSDDAVIAEYHLTKMWGAEPSLSVAIYELEQKDYENRAEFVRRLKTW